MPEKLTKCPNFTRFLPEKIVFARIWGATALPDPPSPTPMFFRPRKVMMYLNKTWQTNGGLGKSDPVKYGCNRSGGRGEMGRTLTFFNDEYQAPVWSLPLYGFPQNFARMRESLCC